MTRISRVLIVEDDELLRRILRLALARHNYTVADAYSVATAREALDVASSISTPFDLLLLDINLPDQTGWDLLRHLREAGHAGLSSSHVSAGRSVQAGGLPQVIVMTAVRPAECRLKEFHPAGFLIKPFPIDALLHLVERVLQAPGGSRPVGDAQGEEDDIAAVMSRRVDNE